MTAMFFRVKTIKCCKNRGLAEMHKTSMLVNSTLPKSAKIIMVKSKKNILLELEKTAIMAKDI